MLHKLLNIHKLLEQDLPDTLLFNNTWKKADFYRFCSDSTFWGCCHITKIGKANAATANEALLYLLQCERENLKFPADRKLSVTIKYFFEEAMLEGYFSNPEGEYIDTKTFWENYEETISGISAEPTFEVYKNGQAAVAAHLLNKEDIVSVTTFANKWNNRQYFIEATNAWLLFGWASMA